jgi:hypothetical protein
MMKKRLNSTSLLLVLLSFCCQSVYAIDEVVVTAPRFNSDVISNWSQPVSYGFDSMVNDGPGSYGAAKKAEAKAQCMAAAIEANKACTVASNNNLASNQARCTQVGASMAGVTAGTGVLLFLSGVGAVPGGLLTAAAGTTGTMIYNQCNNMATNISANAKADCAMIFDLSKLKCESI